jgi:multicomponent K+:H+ antiporter subunit A
LFSCVRRRRTRRADRTDRTDSSARAIGAPALLASGPQAPSRTIAAAMPATSLLFVIALPLAAGSLLAPPAARASRNASAWTAAAITAASLAIVAWLARDVFRGQQWIVVWPWVPDIGLDLAFRLDGLALLFALLILLVGLLVILYARYYLSETDPIGRFYGFLMLFMAAMLGVVLADNLLVLAVFWELTSLASFLLISYWNHRADARQGARMALAITGGGGLAMLAGLLLLGHIAGTFRISEINLARETIQAHGLYLPALALILIGAFTKSAQLPFHFWLPAAMAAPTPVSAYLHSATMVKAGIFLLARLYPALGDNPVFEWLVAPVGLATMLFAAYVAIFKHDLKGLLAYSTISHLGLIVFLIGLDSPLSTVAAVFHIVNHATFKASLFMAAGIIDHECGTRDMRRINGLAKYMPITTALGIVAASAMAGVPFLNGFLSKEMFFGESLQARELGAAWWVVPVAATLGGAFSFAYSARFVHDVFFNGEPRNLPKKPHEPPRFMRLPVELLVVACIAVGLAPALTVGPIVRVAGQAVYGGELPPYYLAIWHGFNLPLAMSAIASVVGAALYWALAREYRLHLHTPAGLTGRLIFMKAHDAAFRFARVATRWLGNGSLQRYAALLVLAAVVAGVIPFLGAPLEWGALAPLPANAVALVVWLVLAIAALGSVLLHRQRFIALVLVAAAGLVVALVFVYFSAPDLALTQISVELVTAVLMMMALALLPQRTPQDSSAERKLRDALLASAAGLGLGALAYAAMTRPTQSIAWYLLEQSVPGGGGTNVVNVTLVDFRGFDTFGEITVLGVAGVGVLALLEGLRVRRERFDADGIAFGGQRFDTTLAFAARVLLPFALVVAVYLFLRGHNQPGGGFIAGLVTAVALVMQYMSFGRERAERLLDTSFVRVVGAGVALAGLTGLGAWLFGRPFLTSAHGHPHLPGVGELPLASAALFDLGVYLAVVGATMLTLSALGSATRPPADTAEERP